MLHCCPVRAQGSSPREVPFRDLTEMSFTLHKRGAACVLAVIALRVSGVDDCHSSLLQIGQQPEPGKQVTSKSTATPLAENESQVVALLKQVTTDCLNAQHGCLQHLQELRRRVWSNVQAEANWSGPAMLPSPSKSDHAIGEMTCAGQNQSFFFRHVFKQAVIICFQISHKSAERIKDHWEWGVRIT